MFSFYTFLFCSVIPFVTFCSNAASDKLSHQNKIKAQYESSPTEDAQNVIDYWNDAKGTLGHNAENNIENKQSSDQSKIISPYQNLSPEEVKGIIDYWNGISIIKGRFEQNSENDDMQKGTVWFQKGDASKGKMRIDYDNKKIRIFAFKGELIINDLNDGSKSVYPVSMTPLELFLKSSIKTDKDFVVIDAFQKDNQKIIILALNKDDPSRLTLFFDVSQVMRPSGWIVQDAQGNITKVKFLLDSLQINDKKVMKSELFA
ncbi:MAG: hypothetical protein C0432_02280 [Candidatus Puniceispirillum sp.]|nr:hypothetical protein [Candidatus Pelagibacter sp.]MBA4283103.1 hypothetical protein [Candidatus Puniceispirillum sp.]